MEKREILNRALNVLHDSLNLSEAILFKIEPYTAINKQTVPDSIFQLEIIKKSEERFTKESVEYKLSGKIFIIEVRKTVEPRFLKSGVSYLKNIKAKLIYVISIICIRGNKLD